MTAGPAPLALDGSHGEGGGQILRTALALAVTLQQPVWLSAIRARRPKPGLQPQHLTVVRALAAISAAEVAGDYLGSTELTFAPGAVRAGDWRFDIGAIKGSAGSVPLLFQALLPPLLVADGPSRLTLIGGTHVPWSPPAHYLTEVYLPALAAAGVEAEVTLRRWGWYPAGGGEITARVSPARMLRGIEIAPPPPDAGICGLSAVSRLPRSIAERQCRRAEERLAAAGVTAQIAVEEDQRAFGPGTVVFLAVPGRAGFTALGRRGLPAERVAEAAADDLLMWRATGAAVDVHLADQLVSVLALAHGRSTYTCPTISLHLRTVAWVVEQFLPARVALHDGPPARVEIDPGPAESSPPLGRHERSSAP